MDFHSTSKVQIGVPSFSVACPLLLYVVIKVVVAFVVGRSCLWQSQAPLLFFFTLSLSRVNLLTSSTLVARRRRRSQSVSVLSFPAPAPPASTLVTFPGHSLVSVSCPFFLRDARATTTTATLSHRRRHQLAALNATSSLDHFSPPTSAAAAASSSASPPLRVKRKRRRRIPRSKR